MNRGVNRWILFAAILLMLTRRAAWTEAAESRSFYDGRTITLIISTSPGGATDVAGRLVARHLGKYIPGHPNIIAQNMPGAGGIVSANYLFNVAKPDGPCRKDTPYTSIENMRAAKTPARFGEGGTGSISYVFSSLVAEILDFKVKHVTGYGSAREIDLGVERGEADCRATSDITLVRPPWPTWVQQGFMTFVIQQGPAKSSVLPQTTPTVYELAPPSAKTTLNLMDVMLAYTDFDRPYAAPPGVPKERLQILRDSFDKMLADPNFIVEAKKLVDWDGTSNLSGAELQKKIDKTVTQPPEIIKGIKEILKE